MSASTSMVREIALENSSSIRVFESLGIDYCCGGHKPLSDACRENSLDLDAVLTALQQAALTSEPPQKDWSVLSLESLADHIVETHHAYVRRELPRLAQLSARILHRHGANRPELVAISSVLLQLDEELTTHLAKEEAVLFPFVKRLEQAALAGNSRPDACFSTVASPITQMRNEHDAAGILLAEIRGLSNNFQLPPDACPTYHAFFDGLKEFEQDLHLHIHLENNLLFPRAIALEQNLNI